jgi:hypothetical protein
MLFFSEDKKSNKIETIQKKLFYKLVLGFQGQTKNIWSILNTLKNVKITGPYWAFNILLYSTDPGCYTFKESKQKLLLLRNKGTSTLCSLCSTFFWQEWLQWWRSKYCSTGRLSCMWGVIVQSCHNFARRAACWERNLSRVRDHLWYLQ